MGRKWTVVSKLVLIIALLVAVGFFVDFQDRVTLSEPPREAKVTWLDRDGAQPSARQGAQVTQLVNGIFAAGDHTLSSPQYQMAGTLGEPGLPAGGGPAQSLNYQHQPGFLAAFSSPTLTPTPTSLPTDTPTPLPTDTPTPLPTDTPTPLPTDTP